MSMQSNKRYYIALWIPASALMQLYLSFHVSMERYVIWDKDQVLEAEMDLQVLGCFSI